MTEISKSTYLEHAQSFAILFTNTLNSITEPNSNLAYYTVLTMNNLVPVIGGHQQVCIVLCEVFKLDFKPLWKVSFLEKQFFYKSYFIEVLSVTVALLNSASRLLN